MKPIVGPLKSLMYSRKALIATVDAFFSILSILVTSHLAPDMIEEVLAIIAVLQPLCLVWINAIAKEDSASKSSK